MFILPPTATSVSVLAFLRLEVMMNTQLIINSIDVRVDEAGRFCLNDLHRAAGGEKRHQPSNWLRSEQAEGLIEELQGESAPHIRGTAKIPPISRVVGGLSSAQGTFVVRELVYAYAMWISPKFHLKVIRTFDALATGETKELLDRLWQESRLVSIDNFKLMQALVERQVREANVGLEFSRLDGLITSARVQEAELLNSVILGMTSSVFRCRFLIKRPIRDYLPERMVKAYGDLETVNFTLLDIGLEAESRKTALCRRLQVAYPDVAMFAEIAQMELQLMDMYQDRTVFKPVLPAEYVEMKADASILESLGLVSSSWTLMGRKVELMSRLKERGIGFFSEG